MKHLESGQADIVFVPSFFDRLPTRELESLKAKTINSIVRKGLFS
jgi:hypothetical protein